MASRQVTIKNESDKTAYYTVTVQSGDADCHNNEVEVWTIKLAPGGTQTKTVSGFEVKSQSTSVTLV